MPATLTIRDETTKKGAGGQLSAVGDAGWGGETMPDQDQVVAEVRHCGVKAAAADRFAGSF
jgi:hypothetical protein